MRFKIDWASLIVGNKVTIFALFYFVFDSNSPSASPPGGLYLEGRFDGGFFALPVWGAYIWRGFFSEFCGYITEYFTYIYEYFDSESIIHNHLWFVE